MSLHTPQNSQPQGQLIFEDTPASVSQLVTSSIANSSVLTPDSNLSTTSLLHRNDRASSDSAAHSHSPPVGTCVLFNTNPGPLSGTPLVAATPVLTPTNDLMEHDLQDDGDSNDEDFGIEVPKIEFISLEVAVDVASDANLPLTDPHGQN